MVHLSSWQRRFAAHLLLQKHENNTEGLIRALSFSLWYAVGHRVATPLSLSTYQRVNLFAMQIPSDRC